MTTFGERLSMKIGMEKKRKNVEFEEASPEGGPQVNHSMYVESPVKRLGELGGSGKKKKKKKSGAWKKGLPELDGTPIQESKLEETPRGNKTERRGLE